jgi:hypothetical protein
MQSINLLENGDGDGPIGGAAVNAWIAEFGNAISEGGNFFTGVDISSVTYGFSSDNPPSATMKLVVYGLNPGNVVLIEFCSSRNAFVDYVSHAQFTVVGPIGATSDQGDKGTGEGLAGAFYPNPVYFKAGPYDQNVASIPWGQSGPAILGVRLTFIEGTNPDITLQAWFEY